MQLNSLAHPTQLPAIDVSVRVSLNNNPALVGTNATFACPPGQVFSGPIMSTCMENGEWELDLQEACLISPFTLLLI